MWYCYYEVYGALAADDGRVEINARTSGEKGHMNLNVDDAVIWD